MPGFGGFNVRARARYLLCALCVDHHEPAKTSRGEDPDLEPAPPSTWAGHSWRTPPGRLRSMNSAVAQGGGPTDADTERRGFWRVYVRARKGPDKKATPPSDLVFDGTTLQPTT